jgi:hypothetical protein
MVQWLCKMNMVMVVKVFAVVLMVEIFGNRFW